MDAWEITVPLDHPGLVWPMKKPWFPIHLDAVLAAVLAGPSPQRGAGGDHLPPIPLPLAQTDGVYHASAAVALRPLHVERVTLTTRHREDWNHATAYSLGRYGKPSTYQAGSYHWTEFLAQGLVAQTPGLRFWAVGDGDALAAILRRLRFIGPWRARGFGRVRTAAIQLRRVSRDYSWWLPNGRPARVLPVRVVPAADPSWAAGMARATPPYWAQAGREWCVWPDPHLVWPDVDPDPIPPWLAAAPWVGRVPERRTPR